MKKILGILAISVMAVCFAGCSKNSPEAVMKDYLKAMKNGDFAKALSYTTLSSEEQSKMVSLYDAFLSEDDKAAMKEMSYEITETVLSEDGESATVKYISRVGDEEKESEQKILKVDGKWKVEGNMGK